MSAKWGLAALHKKARAARSATLRPSAAILLITSLTMLLVALLASMCIAQGLFTEHVEIISVSVSALLICAALLIELNVAGSVLSVQGRELTYRKCVFLKQTWNLRDVHITAATIAKPSLPVLVISDKKSNRELAKVPTPTLSHRRVRRFLEDIYT
jgi:hypothetical protein